MRRAPAVAALLLAALATHPADAQPVAPVRESFPTADGVLLQRLLHLSPKGALRNDAVVVLVYPPGPERDMLKGNWQPLIDALTAEGFHVFRFDWRGHGGSTDITDPLGVGVDPDSGFYVNRVTGVWNQRHVKGGTNLKKAPAVVRVKDGVVNLPGYFPVFVNDLAAARVHLDQLNDRGLINTCSIYLVGAGDAATLGFLWLAAEWARPADRPLLLAGLQYRAVPRDSVPPLLGGPAGADVGGAVWLSASRPPVVPAPTVQGWARGAVKMRDENPMLFLYGGSDATAAKDAKFFYDQALVVGGNQALGLPPVVGTFRQGFEKTNLNGVNLLGSKDVNAEAKVVDYLKARQNGRGQAVRRARNYAVPYHVDPVAFGLRP